MRRRNFMIDTSLAATGFAMGIKSSNLFAANDRIQIGVIGTGSRGAYEVALLREIPGVKVIACCDILPGNLEDGLREAGQDAAGYTDYRELFARDDIDAVVIATPLYLHYPMSLDALAAGKHIYCEKTMTYNIDEAIDLVRRVKNKSQVFQVGYQWRTNPLQKTVVDLIRSGELGRITHIFAHYHRNGNWRRPVSDTSLEKIINWRMYREFSGGLMTELRSHQIDVANWILEGHPEKVTGIGGLDYWKDGREIFDNVTTVFAYPNGVKALFSSITTNAQMGVVMKILGTEAAIEIRREQGQEAFIYAEPSRREMSPEELDGVTSATQKAWESGEGVPVPVPDRAENDDITSRIALAHFVGCIRSGQQPESNVETGRDAAVAVHMANRSMETGEMEVWRPGYSG